MPRKCLNEIAEYLFHHKDVKVCIDSRLVKKGDVFFAFSGTQTHGNTFIQNCLDQGARYIIAESNSPYLKHKNVIATKNSHDYLIDLAANLRERSSARFVAITGSNGKTTTKDLTHFALNNKNNQTLKTQGNYNNLIGVPFTLSQLKEHHQYAVIECGTNQPGEIKQLVEMVKPEVSVITSINAAHLSGLKSVKGIAEEKSDILNSTNEFCLIRKIDAKFSVYKEKIENRKFAYIDDHQEFSKLKSLSSANSISWLYKKQKFTLESPALHNINNSMTAIYIAEYFGIPLRHVSSRLKKWKPNAHRMCVTQWKKRKIIDDCYNANPASVVAAVDTAAEIKEGSRKNLFVVFGNMNEMGGKSKVHHKKIGKFFAEKGVDVLLTYGEKAKASVEEFSKQGGKACRHFENLCEITTFLKVFTQPHDIILIKGSRSLQLERIIQKISTTESRA